MKRSAARSSLTPVSSQIFTRIKLARRKGFEPLTPRFEVWCSIQLSYRRMLSWKIGRGTRPVYFGSSSPL